MHLPVDIAPQPTAMSRERELAQPTIRCQLPSGSRPAWCVVATYAQAERRAHAALHRFGYEVYLPLITSRWRDRTWHTSALFPGYLFVRLDLSRPWYPIRFAPGVFQLLAIDGQPSICPDGLVEALREGEALRGTPTTLETLYRPGALCEAVLRGGLKLEGVVLSVSRGKARIATMMLGYLREMVVALDNLRLRGE